MIFLVLCTSILRPVSAATARHLRSVGPDLRDAPIARPAVFYMLLAIAVATILGSVLCLYRDVMRHKQYNQFQSRGEERDAAVMEALTPQKREPRRERVPSAESDTAAQVPSTIEDHIEGLIESVVQMRLPPQLQFARYLESLQSISPLYASVRCMSALCRPGRNLAILRERTAPLSITWLLMISRLVNFIVCVAVITYLFLANPGVCSMGGSSEAACRRPLRLDGHRQLCVWDEALEECGFDATTPGSSDDVGNDWLYYYLVLPVLSLLLASPLNLVCESVISLYIDSMRLHTADFKSSKFSLPLRLVECSASPVLRSTPPRGAEKGAQRQQVTAPRETLIRAVRLFNLQGHLDKVDLPDEKNSIMNSMSLSGHQRTRLLRLFCVPEKCDAAEYVNGVVENRVRRTRKDCRDICTEVMPLLGALAREQYLVRLFLQQLVSMGCSLSAHCESPLKAAVRGEAARCYLFGDLHSPVPSSQAPQVDTDTALLPHVAKACGYLFILISYLLGCCATLFVFGAHLGKAHSAAWVDRVVISYLIVFVVLDPLRAFVYEVSMHCIANRTLQPLAETLVQRTGYVLSRLSGQLDMDSCGVQSALVACRVARTFPSLPIARLLMSLRDADVVGVQKRTIDSQAWCNFLSGPVAAISLGRLLLVLRHHVGSTLVYFTLGAGFVLSLQFGSTIAAIAVAVIVCVQWGVSNFYFILCAYETIMLFVVSRMCCCLFSSAKYTIVKQSAGSHPPVVVRGLSSESLEGRDVVEFRNVDSMELGYFSDKQESIRSEQKNKNSPLLLPQNSFLRNPSLASFGSHPRAGASVSRSSSDRHERHRSMDSVSLHSENSAQSGPIMLIKHMRSNTFSSSEEEESSDDDDMSSRGRGIDHLLGGSVKRPASRSPRKKRSPPNTNGSPKKTTKKGHYSPALRRLSSLRRSSSHEGTPAGGEDATCEELMISGGVPDVSAVGDIQRNRWVRLKRTWAAGSSASRGNRGYPIPYTVVKFFVLILYLYRYLLLTPVKNVYFQLESINEEDIEVIDEKPYIYGHISPKSDSKRYLCRNED